jgi:hypothetical protein
VPIETTDVIPRSVRALDQLREIREKLDTDNSVSVVEAGLPAFTQQLDEWWKVKAATIKQFAFRATDQRCLMAMALVRPGRCLERLAGDQFQGVERGGERLWCQKM